MVTEGESGKEPDASLQLNGQDVTVADGVLTVGGRKMVLESDLIAAKKSLEVVADQAQASHNTAIDSAKLEVSAAQQQIATLTAAARELKDARESGATTSNEDVAKLKGELEAANKSVTDTNVKMLDMRRASIVLQSAGTVTTDQLANKSEVELTAFEEAIQIVNKSNGSKPGEYMIGGGSGGGVAPETPMERASRLLASTPIRGTRTVETT
jgi:cell division protein FtsL